MGDMLTKKEAEIIGELLTYEEIACKKARLYARTLTDVELAQSFEKIANNHQKRFFALFDELG